MATRLTAKQRLFIAEYLACLNATEAARRAGYSEKTARFIGSENLTKPHIWAEIEKQFNARIMGANEAAARLSEQARGDLGEFIGLEDGEFATHPQSRLLKKFKKTTRTYKDKSVEVTIEFELYSAQAALELIGKYHAIFTDRMKVDDWKSQAILDIQAGRITFKALADAFDESLARQLFATAGVSVGLGSDE